MAEKLVTAAYLETISGVKSSTIYKWRRRGILTGYSTEGTRLIRFKETEFRKVWQKMKPAKIEKPSCANTMASGNIH